MKKFLLLLVILMVLTTMGLFIKKTLDKPVNPTAHVSPTEVDYYSQQLLNYVPREKTIYAETDNADFQELLDEAFRYYLGNSYLGMHYKMKDFRSFGIEKPDLVLAKIKYQFDEDNYNKEMDFLNRMKDFDFESLSRKQQNDYECLEYSIYEDLLGAQFWMYGKVFTDSNCIPEDIYSSLNDFTFYDEESVQDYLVLISTYDQLFDDCIAYTDAQYKDGIYLLDSNLDYTKDAIEGVLATKNDPELISGFNAKIDKMDEISLENKAKYKEENKRIVEEVVYPAYEKLLPKLKKYYGKSKNIYDAALCNIDPGYAQYNFIISTSNTKEVSELLVTVINAMRYFEEKLFYADDAKMAMMDEIEFDSKYPFTKDAQETLEYLRLNANRYYPELGDADYDAQFLNPDTAPSSVIAYYYPSPIDDTNQNIIRINPNNIGGGYSSYITLAHEGFPGHLFQHVYQARMNQSNIHDAIGFIGFTEGFALYASRDALLYSGIEDTDITDIAFYLDQHYFLAYSVVDILVNQYGYKADEVKQFFKDYIGIDYFRDSYNEICEFMIARPGTYERYGVGFAELLMYRLDAEELLKDKFNPVEFNEIIIKDGDMPFVLLNDKLNNYLDQYIEINN